MTQAIGKVLGALGDTAAAVAKPLGDALDALTKAGGGTSFPIGATAALADAVFLNRAIYGGADDLNGAFLNDYDPARDPDAVDSRSAINVYDRYDLYLEGFGFRTLSAAELGFAPAEISASEATDGLDRNFTYAGDLYRNTYLEVAGLDIPFTDAGAVALAAVKETAAGRELHLVFRGTDADLGIDGEAGTAIGQARYYAQLKSFIDQAYLYAANVANGITDVVVSGHSLGGAMADLFAIFDGARFEALEGVDLQVVALASAGVDPGVFALMDGFDEDIVQIDAGGISFDTPDWYAQYDNSGDIVRNPETYSVFDHLLEDPTQAPVTQVAVGLLYDHIHFEDNRLSVETPMIDQYEISANFDTNFLSLHYASYYELVGQGVAEAAEFAGDLGYDRVIALSGINENLAGTPGDNNANGWNVPIDDTYSTAGDASDIFIVGLDGDDTIRTGGGSDLLHGGTGDDVLKSGAGADILVGGEGDDSLHGGAGIDTASYAGSADDYFVFYSGDNPIYVSDINLADGDEGADMLSGIEQIAFLGDDAPVSDTPLAVDDFLLA